MTQAQKKEFITQLVESIKREMLEKVHLTPDSWDGQELRQWLVDLAEKARWIKMSKKRRQDYNNVITVNNLL